MAKAIKRVDGRKADELRAIKITPNFVASADGSCLYECGSTRVICTACIVPGVPEWRKGSGKGWLTAEYGMLPASTNTRKSRPGAKPDGRSVEIQRLIGRAVRCVVDFSKFADNTIYLDCDVLQADGGTRTAAINGAYVALRLAQKKALADGLCKNGMIRGQVAAVSVGLLGGKEILDLNYVEDSSAEVDMNIVMTDKGKFVELQGCGEKDEFDWRQVEKMVALAKKGIGRIMKLQRKVINQGR